MVWVIAFANPDSFIMTRNSRPSTRTGKKRGTATQAAPNQTTGPLGAMATLLNTYNTK